MINVLGRIQRRDSVFDRALLVLRRSPLWLRAGVVFIHVPKAAGTSMSEALYGRFMGHVRALDVQRWGSSAVRSLPRVAVVRNPWDRLVSAYRYVRRGGGTGPNAGGVWHAEQYRVPQFETFDRFVREWLVHQKFRTLDLVFLPQSDFVCDRAGKVIVDHVGRFEDLEPTVAYLRERMSTLGPLERSNQSGEAVDYRSFYTEGLVDLVGEIYAEDVERLGYAFDGPSCSISQACKG